jgi:hypothetical protein
MAGEAGESLQQRGLLLDSESVFTSNQKQKTIYMLCTHSLRINQDIAHQISGL